MSELTLAEVEEFEQLLQDLSIEMNGMHDDREDIRSAMRTDNSDDINIQSLNIIKNAKTRIITHATAIITLMTP